MDRYRTRPHNVQAVQWFPGVEVPGWDVVHVSDSKWNWGTLRRKSDRFLVNIVPGHWLVLEHECAPRVLTPYEFEDKYERIPS
jgi:hypothetical protein